MAFNSFLFITPLTPLSHRTQLRSELFQCYLQALNKQTHHNWQALLIGEEDKKEGNCIYIKTNSVTKQEKLMDAYEFILRMPEKPDFIIRLDDDDVISPHILEIACTKKFDCYADKHHLFYDITSAMTSRQKRNWLPNTIIHKAEHALAPFGPEGKPLFTHDHSKAWHVYYKGRKIKWASKRHPVYMRILSPTSISGKVDYTEYSEYLKGFGKWRKKIPSDFEGFQFEYLKLDNE